MKLLGLNSPEIFIILVIVLSILGTKRIEKGFLLFKKLLKYLLNTEENQTLDNSKIKSEKPVESVVKEETIEAEVKSEKPGENVVKEEIIEAEVKSEELEESIVKKEIKEEKVKSIKSKKRAVKDKMMDVKVNSDDK